MNILKNRQCDMLKKFLFLMFLFLPNILFAFDCSKYLYDIDVDINYTVGDVNVKKSDKDLVKKLGYTEPKISYSVMAHEVFIPVDGGFCVSLRGLDIKIMENFDITIDKRLKEKSCAYDIVFKHEQDHVNTYKDIIKNNIDDIKQTIKKESKNIKPVFSNQEDKTIDFTKIIKESDFAKKIEKDIKSKFDSENKKIDERGDSYLIWKCDDFYKEWKNTNMVID